MLYFLQEPRNNNWTQDTFEENYRIQKVELKKINATFGQKSYNNQSYKNQFKGIGTFCIENKYYTKN